MVNWENITLNELKNLKVIKVFGKHHHAKEVVLLEGNIVKKSYSNTPTNLEHFDREIKFLTYLKDYKYVSKLIYSNRDTLTLYVTYCGKTPDKTPENLEKIRERAVHLYNKTGFIRREPDGTMVKDIFRYNTGILNGKIYFFDFGGEKWNIEQIPKKKKKEKDTLDLKNKAKQHSNGTKTLSTRKTTKKIASSKITSKSTIPNQITKIKSDVPERPKKTYKVRNIYTTKLSGEKIKSKKHK